MAKRIAALTFIFVCTTIAWMFLGSTIDYRTNTLNPNLKSPYTQQWNFTIERQIASFGLRASYVGARTIDLVYRRNLNLPAPSTIPPLRAMLINVLRYTTVVGSSQVERCNASSSVNSSNAVSGSRLA